MKGIIDVGGGLRGIYGAGVLDYCMENGISFDYCSGVSAGSANMASYAAGQRGRNYSFYHDYSFRKEYISPNNFIKDGSYVDLDYVYSALSNHNGENPLDYIALCESNKRFIVVAMDAQTGLPHYFTENDMDQDNYNILKASCCVPIVNHPYFINGVPYLDGGIVDPIPVEKAFADGCSHVVVVLTRPRDYYRTSTRDAILANIIKHKYPAAAQAMREHAEIYNIQLDLIKSYEKQGKVQIIAPDTIGNMSTFTKDKNKLDILYHKGYQDAQKLK